MFFSHIHQGPGPSESTKELSGGLGTWCLPWGWGGGPGGNISLRTVLGRPTSCPTRVFTMESWGRGWSWHICDAHWKPSVLRGKGTFSWVFRSKSINQPQRNTSEAQSGFLAGRVITKATGWLCIFCSCWRLSRNFGAVQVQPWLAWVCRSWKSGRREEGKGAGREKAQLWSPCCGPLPVTHMMNGFLQISGLSILDVSTGKD